MDEFAGLFKHFSVLPDPRVERGKKHKLMDVLFIGLATMRRLAINMVKRVKGKSSIRASFKKAGWNTLFLERIFAGPE